MENKVINIQLVAKVAKALGKINEQVVFVGGAVVSVYADVCILACISPYKLMAVPIAMAELKHKKS